MTALAAMARDYGDELACDFAETYRVLDWRALPPLTAATLACGLPPGSRTAMRMAGMRDLPEKMLLAAIADRLGLLLWAQTKDGMKGRNAPKQLVEWMAGGGEREGDSVAFSTPEDFMAAWEAAGE